MSSSDRWVWMDLEMTGLRPEHDSILEIASVITTHDLEIVAQGPSLVIYQSPEVLSQMSEEVRALHQASGLLTEIPRSTCTLAEAEAQTLEFLKSYVDPKTSPICGNTIAMDRRFLYVHMPRLEAFFHYRHLDVSTVKILAQAWRPKDFPEGSKKDSRHRALEDILESIEELRHYRDAGFVGG